MVSHAEVMSMLRRNADYNDRAGSAVGAGYIGGCGSCACGGGYIGGFRGERRLLAGVRSKKYQNAEAKRAAIRAYLEAAGDELAEYGNTPDKAIAQLERRRSARRLVPKVQGQKCSGMPVGLSEFCLFKEKAENQGKSRDQLSLDWAIEKWQKTPNKLSKKQRLLLADNGYF